MEPSLPWAVLKSMVRIEEGESTMLDLSTSTLNQRNTEYVVAFFKAIATTNSHLVVAGRSAPCAQGLTIRCSFASSKALVTLCDYLMSQECTIRILILSLTHLTERQVQLLFPALCRNSSIQDFAIYATNVGSLPMRGSNLKQLLIRNNRIQKLTLVQVHLNMACYHDIAHGLVACYSLSSLSLDSCTPNAEATKVLLQAVSAMSTLCHLHLGHVHLSHRAMDALVTATVRQHASLKELSIVAPEIDPFNSQLELADLLHPNSVLEKLTLHGCRIDDELAPFIFRALEINQNLRELNLPRNHLGQLGYLAMLASMRHWKFLQRLGVDGGGALLSCKEGLVQGMQSNRSLHHLGLETFDLGPYNPQIRSHTRRFLRRNRRLDKLRALVVQAHASHEIPKSSLVPPGLWPHVIRCSSLMQPDCIEMTQLFQIVSTHAVEWPVFQKPI